MPSPSLRAEKIRPNTPMNEQCREMMIWAEPIIADRIWESYREHQVGAAARSLLAVHHRRFWRALILGKMETAEELRGELLLGLAQAGIPGVIAAEIDNDVMEELMDIVFTRFRASRDTMRDLSRVLLAAASNIGAARLSGVAPALAA